MREAMGRRRRVKNQYKTTTLYNNNPWSTCNWCSEWERNSYHIEVIGIGKLCLRCLHFGPPHFEYLLGLRINHRLLLREDAFAKLTFTAHHLVVKIASFAYKPCTITQLSAIRYGIVDDSENKCKFCDKLWTGWKCPHGA